MADSHTVTLLPGETFVKKCGKKRPFKRVVNITLLPSHFVTITCKGGNVVVVANTAALISAGTINLSAHQKAVVTAAL